MQDWGSKAVLRGGSQEQTETFAIPAQGRWAAALRSQKAAAPVWTWLLASPGNPAPVLFSHSSVSFVPFIPLTGPPASALAVVSQLRRWDLPCLTRCGFFFSPATNTGRRLVRKSLWSFVCLRLCVYLQWHPLRLTTFLLQHSIYLHIAKTDAVGRQNVLHGNMSIQKKPLIYRKKQQHFDTCMSSYFKGCQKKKKGSHISRCHDMVQRVTWPWLFCTITTWKCSQCSYTPTSTLTCSFCNWKKPSWNRNGLMQNCAIFFD